MGEIVPLTLPEHLCVVAWIDPLVDDCGFAPRSPYVETCWLPILGPTATWLYRRLGTIVTAHPKGVEVNLIDLSRSLGLGVNLGHHSKLGHALCRLVRFGAGQWQQGQAVAVRRLLPPLSERQVLRLPATCRIAHETIAGQRHP